MKTKILILSLITTAMTNIPASFAKEFIKSRKVQTSLDRRLEIYPVKFSKTKDKNCVDYNDTNLLFLSKKPAVSLENFKFQTSNDDGLNIKFHIDDKAQKKLKKLAKNNSYSSYAVVLDGKIQSVPTLQTVGKDNVFNFSLNGQKKFENILKNLNGTNS